MHKITWLKNLLFGKEEGNPWYQQNKNQKWIFLIALTISFIVFVIL